MTVLLAPAWMDAKRAGPIEHWHSTVMHGGVISSVVVGCNAHGTWTVRTQLRDRALNSLGDSWKSGPFDTHEAALDAGHVAALRLHKALVGTHQVPELPSKIAILQPVGGYQSQALRRFAQAQPGTQAMRLPMVLAKQVAEAEMMA